MLGFPAPTVWNLDFADSYSNIDFEVNTNGTLIAVYGTYTDNNRGFFDIIKIDTLETQVHREHETQFIDFDSLTWYNSSHFVISG